MASYLNTLVAALIVAAVAIVIVLTTSSVGLASLWLLLAFIAWLVIGRT